jgi:hypothetical protein
MFDIHQYEFDKEHNCLDVAGETMIFHCHHYVTYLQRSILDATYIDSRRFLIGSAADAAYHQLSNLCQGLEWRKASKWLSQCIKHSVMV